MQYPHNNIMCCHQAISLKHRQKREQQVYTYIRKKGFVKGINTNSQLMYFYYCFYFSNRYKNVIIGIGHTTQATSHLISDLLCRFCAPRQRRCPNLPTFFIGVCDPFWRWGGRQPLSPPFLCLLSMHACAQSCVRIALRKNPRQPFRKKGQRA